MDWSGVDYLWIIVMFLSAVWTLILTAPIHCRASIDETVMQCYISPNLMKKQTHPNLGWPEVSTFSVNVHFWVNYSFNFPQTSQDVPSLLPTLMQYIFCLQMLVFRVSFKIAKALKKLVLYFSSSLFFHPCLHFSLRVMLKCLKNGQVIKMPPYLSFTYILWVFHAKPYTTWKRKRTAKILMDNPENEQ